MKVLILAVVNNANIALFGLLIFLIFFILLAFCFFEIWLNRRPSNLSPYSHFPLSRGSSLSYMASEKVLRFLYDMYQYDNRMFNLKRAAVCRETGRIFPNALTWYDTIKVKWSFLQKRHPGKYVSWGSLTPEQQEIIRSVHENLKGFQTKFSSPQAQPSAIEAKYAFTKPGPLYVDIETNILLGWKVVPGTDLEVMIVQKPTHIIITSL